MAISPTGPDLTYKTPNRVVCDYGALGVSVARTLVLGLNKLQPIGCDVIAGSRRIPWLSPKNKAVSKGVVIINLLKKLRNEKWNWTWILYKKYLLKLSVQFIEEVYGLFYYKRLYFINIYNWIIVNILYTMYSADSRETSLKVKQTWSRKTGIPRTSLVAQ